MQTLIKQQLYSDLLRGENCRYFVLSVFKISRLACA